MQKLTYASKTYILLAKRQYLLVIVYQAGRADEAVEPELHHPHLSGISQQFLLIEQTSEQFRSFGYINNFGKCVV